MQAQWRTWIKELGGSEAQVKAYPSKMITEKMLEGARQILESIGLEERSAFQEEQGVRANGYYQRDLVTPLGTIEGLNVPRVRSGDFHLFFLQPHKRHLCQLEELVSALYAGGLFTRDISRNL